VYKRQQLYIGEAGVGKSRFILDNYMNRAEYVRLGPTGVSAYSVRGSTLSSFFCLGPTNSNTVLEAHQAMTYQRKQQIQDVGTLIIDECYMVTADVMVKVSELLKLVCCSCLDFANKRIIMFGDDRQLSSVGESFMGSQLYSRLNVIVETIEYIPRMSRLVPKYRERCNWLRTPRFAYELEAFIDSAMKSCSKVSLGVENNVYYTNEDVANYNNKIIAELPGEPVVVNSHSLKPNATIMLKRNGRVENGIYSGRICKFIDITPDQSKTIILLTESNDCTRKITLTDFTSIVPAYAFTIHKSQSLTLPYINIHIRRSQLSLKDATRLLYVAMTRVQSIKNLYLEYLD
jgi:ATP-dependent exoDNAse (exonuclease V) alpha subunit